MSDPQAKKDRNQKRIQDKHKNKKHVSKNVSEVKNKNKSNDKLNSSSNNWDQYEEHEDEDQFIERDDSNFATLSSNMSERNYFQFKFEKKWLEEVKQNTASNCGYFNLDLNLLNTALGTMPLHERCSLPIDLFTADEINKFESDAEEYKIKYEKLIQNENLVQENKSEKHIRKTNLDVTRENIPKKINFNANVDIFSKELEKVAIDTNKSNEIKPKSSSKKKVKNDGQNELFTTQLNDDVDDSDEELDFLLSLSSDSWKGNKQNNSSFAANNSTSENTKPLDEYDADLDDLDFILSS